MELTQVSDVWVETTDDTGGYDDRRDKEGDTQHLTKEESAHSKVHQKGTEIFKVFIHSAARQDHLLSSK